MASLDESLAAIMVAAQEAVELEVGGGTLSEVKAVVAGRSARPMPALPCIWLVPQPASFSQDSYGEETWVLPLSIAALVKGDDPPTAEATSRRLTALARRAVLRSEVQMEVAGAQVTKIASSTFDPIARSTERNRTLFWTEAVVNITFTVIE